MRWLSTTGSARMTRICPRNRFVADQVPRWTPVRGSLVPAGVRQHSRSSSRGPFRDARRDESSRRSCSGYENRIEKQQTRDDVTSREGRSSADHARALRNTAPFRKSGSSLFANWSARRGDEVARCSARLSRGQRSIEVPGSIWANARVPDKMIGRPSNGSNRATCNRSRERRIAVGRRAALIFALIDIETDPFLGGRIKYKNESRETSTSVKKLSWT